MLVVLAALCLAQTLQAQSYVLSNLWNVAAGASTHPFLSRTDNNTRGLAYNPVTDHLLVVSRTSVTNYGTNTIYGTNSVYVLDAKTGAVTGKLPEDPNIVKGGTFVLNMIGVTDDGVIYVGNLTTDATNATSGPFKLYRWADETALPTLAYSGDPSFTNTNGSSPRRFGDSLTLRGSGTGTQILLGTFNNVVGLLTTTDGANFTATKLTTDAGVEETRRALAWGAGNTFWAKTIAGNLRQFNLNLANQTASNVTTVALPSVYAEALDVDVSRNLAAIVCTNHTLRLYDIFDPALPLQQDATRSFPSLTNANGNWVGSAALRNKKLFAMDVNNGIMGYDLKEIYLPPTILTQPAGVTIWENAAWWKFNVVVSGTRPFTFQWRFNGTNIPGATGSSLTLSNITVANQGNYSVLVSNTAGGLASSSALMSVVSSAASAQVTNIWDVPAGTRPYLTTGYKEYGVAINPLTTNVIVVTRANPTNMIAVLDGRTGAHIRYIDYSALTIVGGMNKVCVADDGVIFVCNLTTDTTTAKFTIYGFLNENPLPSETGWLYNDDPGAGVLAPTIGWGANIDARGGGMSTEILIGGGKYSATPYDANAVAILQYDSIMSQFVSTPIVITNAPTGNNNFRFGICWGAGDSFWAKGLNGLMYIQFDRVNRVGGVIKSYPTSGPRSVPSSVTAMAFNEDTGLLCALQNGSPPTPVSVPFYDVSDPVAGPLWTDHEVFASYNEDIEFQGSVSFERGYAVALGVNNGLKAFKVNPAFTGSLPLILTQPVGGTWYEGTSPTLSVVADSASTMTYQWYFNGSQLLPGATSATLTITNITASQAGDYMVRVTNAGGSRDSRPATIATLPLYNTAQMTNIWSLLPGTRPYLNTAYFEYGLAFNPVNSNLLIASYISTNPVPVTLAVVDGLTGLDKHVLNPSPITNAANRLVNKVGIADDGAVYVANRTTTPATLPFVVYRYANDDAATAATEAFKGDPFQTMYPNQNCGWTLDVRGAGANTEILLSTFTNVVSILKTTDGTNFTANEIYVPGAPARFARLGVCFGPGNTFWAKAWQGDGGNLLLVQYDLGTRTGTVLQTYAATNISSTVTTIAYNDTLRFLGGIALDTQKNVQVYSVADLSFGPSLLDQEVFPSYNPSIEGNGALDFGGNNYLFALNENNGVMAFLLNNSYQPPVSRFKILNIKNVGSDIVITWESQNGAAYQVQSTDTLGTGWVNLGTPITASGSTTSYTNAIGTGPRFYRISTPYTGP